MPDEKSLQELFADLQGTNVSLRRRAIKAVCALPVEQLALADNVLLLRGLDDSNASIRMLMASVLAYKGERAAIPQLKRLVRDKWVRDSALSALVQLSTSSWQVVVELLRDDDPALRTAGVELLELASYQHLRISRWDRRQWEMSYRGTPSVPDTVAEKLAEISLADATAELVSMLSDHDPTLRASAALTLGRVAGSSVVPALVTALSDQDTSVRRIAARALWFTTRDAAGDSYIPALIRTLRDNDARVRQEAQGALIAAGDRALPDVIALLKHIDETTREAASRILLGLSGAPGKRTRPSKSLRNYRSTLFDLAAHSPDTNVRRAVVEVLGRYRYRSALPTLLTALSDTDPTVRALALRALQRIGDARAVPQLAGMLSDPDVALRRLAVEALGAIKDAKGADTLIVALSDQDPTVRALAAYALGHLEQGSSESEGISRLITDPDVNVRRAAVQALETSKDANVIPALISALADRDPTTRALATQVLGRLHNPSASPALINALADTDQQVRAAAVRALGVVGNRSSIPALVNALSDDTFASDSTTQASRSIVRNPYLDAFDTEIRADRVRSIGANDLGYANDYVSSLEDLIAAADLDLSFSDFLAADDAVLANAPSMPELPTIGYLAAQTLERIAQKEGLASVLFTAYYPREVSWSQWYSLHVYCYQLAAIRAIQADARIRLGQNRDTYRDSASKEPKELAAGVSITLTPILDGFTFNPPSITLRYLEDWHRSEFRLRADGTNSDTASNGKVVVSVEGIDAAKIPLSIFVRGHTPLKPVSTVMGDRSESDVQANDKMSPLFGMASRFGDRRMEGTASATSLPIGRIFCSYSHRDEKIVRRVERACKSLGIDFLRDTTTLKSGERWSTRLLNMIDEADAFQLFWSKHAAASRNVQQEWRYALQFDSEHQNFIRPVFWQRPMPPVPKELNHLHFSYVPDLGKAE